MGPLTKLDYQLAPQFTESDMKKFHMHTLFGTDSEPLAHHTLSMCLWYIKMVFLHLLPVDFETFSLNAHNVMPILEESISVHMHD